MQAVQEMAIIAEISVVSFRYDVNTAQIITEGMCVPLFLQIEHWQSSEIGEVQSEAWQSSSRTRPGGVSPLLGCRTDQSGEADATTTIRSNPIPRGFVLTGASRVLRSFKCFFHCFSSCENRLVQIPKWSRDHEPSVIHLVT